MHLISKRKKKKIILIYFPLRTSQIFQYTSTGVTGNIRYRTEAYISIEKKKYIYMQKSKDSNTVSIKNETG